MIIRLPSGKSMPRSMEQIQVEEEEKKKVRNYFHSVDYHQTSSKIILEDYKENNFYHSLAQRNKSFGSKRRDPNLSLIFILILIIISLVTGDEHGTPIVKNPIHCTRNGKHNQTTNGTLKCVVSLTGPSKFITISRSIIDQVVKKEDLTFKTGNSRNKIHTLDVTCSTRSVEISDPSVNFTELSDFWTSLKTISITGCNLTKQGLEGTIPQALRTLNLSNNNIDALPEKLFMAKDNHTQFELSSINLSNNNNLNTLPQTLLNLTTIQNVWLSRHNMTCPWVASNLYKWFEKNVLMDANNSDCRLVEYSMLKIQLTTYGALRAKHDESVECNKTLTNCSCSIYTVQHTDTLRTNFPVSFQSHGENVSVTLKVDCSSRNLTHLPPISPLTRFLNVSHNQIVHIDELKNPEYKNLGTLVAEYNQIENIDSVIKTNFVGQFDVFGLSHNNISSLSHQVMSVLLDTEVKGHGRISLGDNYINCDCDTARFVKHLLAKHQKRIADAQNLFCRNWETQVKVKELDFTKVCQLDDENEHNIMWYIIIAVEVCLILLILVKVDHDRRHYRQTGILPFLSIQMPRLPCDTMLEGFKERPNGR